MTEASYPIAAAHGHAFTHHPLTNGVSVPHSRHVAPMAGAAQEDDDEIVCICGNNEDDGLTVACDMCNKWQHQLCYYPEFEDRSLPEDLQHFCKSCRDRPLDVIGATARQRVRREEHALANGIKRPSSKTHKKKPKDPLTNGWPLDKSRHDRNSASPRDQPPPSKKAKTTHRSTESVSTLAKGHSRKRNASTVAHSRSASRSPDSPLSLYSSEFIRCYRDDPWSVTDANLHNSITVTNALSEWLNATEDDFRAMHGCEKSEVLMRWDGSLDDIPGKAQTVIDTVHDERVQDINGNYPTWKTVTVQEPIASGAYIGELKGHVGFKDDYFSDPSNRWPLLRHPEPFVFFHPKVPIYVDARNEGTELRYVRRSCSPNAQLKILVTDSTDYHFCFMATRQIDPGTEIAVPWDTGDGLPELALKMREGNPAQRDLERISSWVSTVMANCGPCGCAQAFGDCLMAHFDRRSHANGDEAQFIKMPKASKKKKAAPQISPLNTHVNSRSGSEARKIDVEDDPSDSRSNSGSARGSASRDITPSTHYSGMAPELSERERRKLAKEEEMFRRQEEEQSGKHVKNKKRNSGGSTLNTPSESKPKQSAFASSRGYSDAGTSKQAGLPSKPGRKPKQVPKQPKVITKVVKRPTPNYVNSSVQCDMDKEDAGAQSPAISPRRTYVSLTTRLLQRCALNNTRRRSQASPSSASKASPSPTMDVGEDSAKRQYVPAEPVEVSEVKDVEMQDAADSVSHSSPLLQQHDLPSERRHTEPGKHADLPVNPPAPPWPSQPSHTSTLPELEVQFVHKSPSMHISMPPPPTNPFAASAMLSSGNSISMTPNSIGGPALATTPASALPPNLVSQTSNSAASPMKKKMSLSDYTKRSKAKDKENVEAKPERDSSPASVASGPIVPPLQAQGSQSTTEQAVDDVNMEDAAPVSSSA